MLRGASTDRNEGIVKKIALAVLLVFSALAWAAGDPNPAEYTVNVHVTSSSIDIERGYQLLNVVIDGKKYELGSELRLGRLLALGDYKAKLVKMNTRPRMIPFKSMSFYSPTRKPGSSFSSGKGNNPHLRRYGRLGIVAMHSTCPFTPSAVFSTAK